MDVFLVVTSSLLITCVQFVGNTSERRKGHLGQNEGC
jgi:hypothetical protein